MKDLIKKMSAAKAIEGVKALNSLDELLECKVIESNEKPRATVVSAIEQRIEFIKKRNEENQNEIVDDKPETTPSSVLYPEKVAQVIFSKVSKSVSFISKAKEELQNKKYIIKDVDDKEGMANVKQFISALKTLRKTVEETRKESTSPYREVVTLVNKDFGEVVTSAKEIEAVLQSRVKEINDAKEKIKAVQEEEARRKLLAEENAKIEAQKKELQEREAKLAEKEEALKRLYPDILKKTRTEEEVSTQPDEKETKEHVIKERPLSEKESLELYLSELTNLANRSPNLKDPKLAEVSNGIAKNLRNIVNHYGSKI